MTQTSEEIQDHIRNTQAQLGENLDELERKAKAAVDWRHHYRHASGAFLAVALSGGLALGLLSRRRRSAARSVAPRSAAVMPRATVRGPLDDALHDIKGALIGVAAGHVKDVLGKWIPGFEEQASEVSRRPNHAPKSARPPFPRD